MAFYAVSDLHGYLDAYKMIKEQLKPEDTVVCLGDCGDRGPQSWKTIKAVMQDPQWVYLKGNHEDMLIKAAQDYFDYDEYYSEAYDLLCYNGGADTFEGLINETSARGWIKQLKNLRTYSVYCNKQKDNLILTHAGFTPPLDLEEPVKTNNLLWNRIHIHDDWPEGNESVIIHGHTPVPHLDATEESCLIYANGHKIDIDLGVFYTGKVCLLNLDNYEEHIFML